MAEIKGFYDINRFNLLVTAKRLEAKQILGPAYRTVEDALKDTEDAIPAIQKHLEAEAAKLPELDIPATSTASVSTSRFALLYHDKNDQAPAPAIAEEKKLQESTSNVSSPKKK